MSPLNLLAADTIVSNNALVASLQLQQNCPREEIPYTH